MKRDAITLTLREACIARGIDPDNTGYKTPPQRLLHIDRIIPGVADREDPSLIGRGKRDNDGYKLRRANARRMYTRQSAANDAGIIADAAAKGEATLAYVAAFCRLNNLTN